MKDLNEQTITEEVLARVSGAQDERMRDVSQALVRHLHAFILEVEPTNDEWRQGIDFLTQVGANCNENRQEFILLSDVLGVSMLVDAINHRMPEGATETTVLGPFFSEGRKSYPLGTNMSEGVAGTPLLVHGTVTTTDGQPIKDAAVDVWHSDGDGYYDLQQGDDLAMRGRFHTDENGKFWLWTVRPSPYPIPHDGPVGDLLRAQSRHPYRPEHVHFLIAAEGCETLVTHVFAEDDPYLESDVVFGVKTSLIRKFEQRPAGAAADGTARDTAFVDLNYDFVLKSNS